MIKTLRDRLDAFAESLIDRATEHGIDGLPPPLSLQIDVFKAVSAYHSSRNRKGGGDDAPAQDHTFDELTAALEKVDAQ